MADESESFKTLVCGGENSVPVSEEEVNVEAKPASVDREVKLPPGVAPIKAQ